MLTPEEIEACRTNEPEPTLPIELTLLESGTLCHALMSTFLKTGGIQAQRPWALELYYKLGQLNDKLMGKV
jgi:hypothetical protein